MTLAGIRALVLGATGRECGTWRCLVPGTSGGLLLVAEVVVEVLGVAGLELVDAALEVAGLELVDAALEVAGLELVDVFAGALVEPAPALELLEAGEEPPQAASSSDTGRIAIGSRGAIAPA